MPIGYADAIATIALLISLGSLALHWHAWRREQASRSPIVDAEVIPGDRFKAPWCVLRVSLRSRSNEGFTMTMRRIDKPKRAWIIPRRLGLGDNPDGNWHPQVATLPVSASNSAIPRLAVAQAGANEGLSGGRREAMGIGDSHHEDFLIRLPEEMRPTSVSMRRSSSRVRLTAFLISQTQARKRKACASKLRIHIQINTAASE